MNPKNRCNPLSARSFSPRAAALMSLATATVVHAANATWTGATDATWATATNWSATPVPGTGAGELATFATAGGADDVINLGAGVTIRTVLFDSAAAAAYTLGSGAAGSQTLTLEGAGAITMNATVAANQSVNAHLNLGTAAGAEAFTITNNKAAASNSLTFAGGISTTQTGNKTLTFAGTGVTQVSGAITNGSGTIVLAKTGAHVLTLSGPNNYSGGTTITGILNASNNTALGTGPVTVNGAAGNHLHLGAGVNVGNALTLNGGGSTGLGVIYLPGDSATYSGTIHVAVAQNAGGTFGTAGLGKLTIAGNNTLTTAGTIPVTVRSGHVAFTGSQGYTTGTTLGTADSRATIQFGIPASMPATGTVTLASGNSIAVNVGGAGEFAVTGTGAGTLAGLLAGTGGQGAAVTLPAGTSVGIDTTNAAGTVSYGNAFTTTNNLGLIKLGTGTLELTAGGTYTGAGAAAFPLVARQGTLLLNGGTHTANGEVVIGGTFGRANGAAGYDAKLQVDSGSFVTNSWLSIGRGNGIGGVSSDLMLNNAGSVTAANISAGFNGGNGANLPKGTITLNHTSTLAVSGNGAFLLGESAGSNMTMTLNGSSQFTAAGNGAHRVGAGGTGVLTVNDSASANIGLTTGAGNLALDVAYKAGSGTVNVNGGTLTVAGMNIARSTAATDSGVGTVNVTGGTLASTEDVIVGMGGTQTGKLVINGGTMSVGAASEKWLKIGAYDTVKGELELSSGTLKLNSGTDIRFTTNGTSGANVVTQSGGAIVSYGDNGVTPGGSTVLDLQQASAAAANNTYHLNGGTLAISQVTSSATNGSRAFNFNGGTLKAASGVNAAAFFNLGTGNAHANVRDGGAVIDTNGFNVTVAQALEQSLLAGDAGTGGLTKLGAGTLTLGSFSNNYTGATHVEAGTLDVYGNLASDIVVKSGAAVTGSGTNTGSLTMNAGSTFAASTTGPLVVNGVTFAGATSLSFNGTPANGTPYVLFRYGAGGVTGLSNLSTSGFRTVITNDTFNEEVTGTVTTASLTWNTTNGTWAANTGGWTGGFTSYFNGDTVAFNERPAASTVTLGGVLTPAAVTVNNTSNPYVFTGSGSIGGETVLTKDGSGALTLATANSYTGGTTLNAGTLNLNHASALGTGLLTITGGTLDNTSGAPITMTGNFPQQWEGDFAFTGSSRLDMGSGAVTVGGESGSRTVTIGANTLTVGELTATGYDFVKQGAGTLEVTSVGVNVGASVVSGTLDVAAGTLQINRTGTNAAASGDFTAAGITGSGTITNGAAVERWFFTNPASGSVTFAGTLANGNAGALGFNKNGAGTQVLSGSNSYTGVTTVAGGELVVGGANSGAGTNAEITAGKLTVASTQALGAASLVRLHGADVSTLEFATDADGTAYALTMASGASAAIVSNRATAGAGVNHTLTTQNLANGLGTGTLNITSGTNVTSGSGRITFTQLGLGAGAAGTTTLNPTTANVTVVTVGKQNNNVSQTLGLGGTSSDNHVTGGIANGPALTGGATHVSVVKTGTSTWTLSGNSTYTGTTAVSAGTLAITGDHSAATGEMTVEASATLAGNGNLGGNLVVNAGANQSLAVAATPGAQVTRTIGGTLTHSFGSVLTLTASSQPANGVYTLATATGGVTFDSGTTVTLAGIAGGTVSVSGNSLVLTVGSGGGAYGSWASNLGLTAGVNDGAAQNPDNDGFENGTEYILGGHPLNGGNNPKVHSLIADGSVDEDTTKELILTIAVPQGTPAFSAGSPASTATFEGFGITVRGSSDLANFTSVVTPVAPVTTGLPPAPVQGGVTYEYRSFSLGGSNGTTGKGFLQVTVTHP